MDRVSPPFERRFAVYQDTQRTVVNTDLAYPEREWILSSIVVGCLAVFLPLGVFTTAQWWLRSFWDWDAAVLGHLHSVLLATLIQVVLKVLVGGLRPSFLDVCEPNLNASISAPEGNGFRDIMYTTTICTETDKTSMRNAMTSFPSGHSAAGLAASVYLFLWLNAKLKVWANRRTEIWRVTVTAMPILLACINCGLLTVDRMHHWYDIVGGALIGIATAFASYRAVYAAVWDWRYNHVFLDGVNSFDYENRDANYAHGTLTEKGGWTTAKRREDS
ncbi:diacylglycerol diphosphate phosphatase / phosphatidate phosphatase [Emericellopsis cladophorae]|uniref:Diacylglycerol diphosphate phosphatase / phosphatidate phosphatase n=1 Tax=Emericellopsis cladophorae TaxID=2686198 RepID=A0A9Q0BBK6_9HYPO|nr:diacylglycerol diphosphate phosphatase / phosphatidate phosphatase [Emericellopsis cladophorae]KAI6778595.1 diacylglycerol diphosphate phosphatase / phosphatidate phosphatase [Emericellopsis cladophorae]